MPHCAGARLKKAGETTLMMAWSTKLGQAYLSREGIRQIKSQLTNDIFKQELLHVYEQKSESRDELVCEARDALLELTRQMQTGICNHPEVEGLMQQLLQALDSVTGKKSYGYLPKPIKKIVDEIVDQMERLPVVSDCYDRWLELRGQVDSYYGGDERKRLPLSQQKEFRAIKNAVIKEAERIRLGETTFEDAGMVEDGFIAPEKAEITQQLIIAAHQNVIYEACLRGEGQDTQALKDKFDHMFDYLLAAAAR